MNMSYLVTKSSGSMTRRGMMTTAGAGLLSVAAPAISRGATLEKVTFQLDWIAYGRHTPYYVALSKGYYADKGLDVKIEQGTGAMSGFRYLGAGQAQFIFQDVGSMIAVRAKEGLKFKAVACMYQKAPHTAFYIKNKGIIKPTDLEGKKIAYSPGNSPKIMFPAFAQANKIDEAKLSWLSVDPNSMNAVLLNHRSDSILTYIFTLPVLQKAAQGGDEVGTFIYSDLGVDFYANAIIATEDYIASNPKTVRGFTQATLKGFEYAVAHPQEAAAIMKTYQPQLDADVAAMEVPLLQELGTTADTKKYGLGSMTKEKMEQTEELTARYLGLTTRIPSTDLFTNDFLA
jgi:NitT/TauT family transport system substrate-binding protein